MQKTELDSVFDSFIYNYVRIFADAAFQKRVWVDEKGSEVAIFEDDMSYLVGSNENLQERPEELTEGCGKYLEKIKILSKMVEKFDHTIFDQQPNKRDIEFFIQHPEWKQIQRFAHAIYQEVQEESWWKDFLILLKEEQQFFN